ncbi:MAG: DUF983 domain-containing protein [Saprospiraceae bacterium]
MNILKSVWTYQCPKCRSAKMFKEPFELSNPLNMHKKCENCGENLEPEPGFYFGAMFISYILSGWMLLVPALILLFVFEWEVNMTMVVVILLAAVTYLKFLRISRSIWIHIIVKYNPALKKQ